MRQLQIQSYGPPRTALRFADVAVPVPAERDVVVKVLAAALNPIDYKMAAGALRRLQALKLPAPCGFDCCGTIEASGPGVSGLASGERVFARLPRQRMGSLADYAVVEARYVAKAPPTLSAADCASLPLVGLTTMQALVDRAHAQPGQYVLIHAGSGGLGCFAIQYAKRELGLHVTTTTSSRNAEWVRGLGADVVIAYDREDYRAAPARYDIVFDTLGGRVTGDSFSVLKRGGVVVSVAGPPDRRFPTQVGAGIWLSAAMRLAGLPMELRALSVRGRYFRFLTESDGWQLRHVAEVVASGKVKPVVDRVFPFDRAVEALEYLAAGRAKGKVVIEISKQ
ncbi:MAG: NADP-dependent oxidoreductase [Steroidobacteraceae bacterium]